jgi:hypothetical protein
MSLVMLNRFSKPAKNRSWVGSFLFDTSAESLLARAHINWMQEHLARHQVHTSLDGLINSPSLAQTAFHGGGSTA